MDPGENNRVFAFRVASADGILRGMASRFGLRGFVLHAPDETSLQGIRDGAVLVEDGRILDVGEYARLKHLPEAQGISWLFGSGTALLPGLIDLHAHLPQYPALARCEKGLLPWLERHIFPLERQFNAASARALAPHFFRELARHGTTQAVLFAAIYEESCHECFLAAEASGLRIILGKVMMDRGSYGSLEPEKIPAISLAESRRLLNRWHNTAQGRLEYAISPRFAVTCTTELMRGAADLARETGAYVQTHLAENHAEIARVRELFPDHASYTAVYADCGLTGPRSLFAHCLHLQPDEIALLRDSGSKIAHCPTSNFFLRSGILPWNELRQAAIPIGLGSDVAAGPELNLWQVMRSALEAQVARSFFQPGPIPSPVELFSAATSTAARALCKENEIGSLEPGKSADILVLDLAEVIPGGRQANFAADYSAEDLLSMLIFRGGPHATLATYVQGRRVYAAEEPTLF